MCYPMSIVLPARNSFPGKRPTIPAGQLPRCTTSPEKSPLAIYRWHVLGHSESVELTQRRGGTTCGSPRLGHTPCAIKSGPFRITHKTFYESPKLPQLFGEKRGL